MEELPAVRENLVIQYKIEKEEQVKISQHQDYMKERAIENNVLYNAVTTKVDSIVNTEYEHSSNLMLSQNKDLDLLKVSEVQRKR